MKKSTINIVMALLWPLIHGFLISITCSFIFFLIILSHRAAAQNEVPVPVLVGDKVPAEVLRIPLTVVTSDTLSIVMLEDFKGKAVILDFWASWCPACLRSMPKTDSLFRMKKGALQVIMVNSNSSHKGFGESIAYIRKYLGLNPGFSTPIVLKSKELMAFLPFTSIPHYVWIGADGYLKAITSDKEVTLANINTFLSGGQLSFTPKTK